VAPREAEDAVLDDDALMLEIHNQDAEERIKSIGMTGSGRILVVVFTLRGEAIRPITAYTATRRLQKLYVQRKGL